MASPESLPDDQRAVLQLLLKQGKSYDDLAALLKRDPAGLRRHAHQAVEALGPGGIEISVDRRHEIADYLLGQQTASQRAATREYLEESSAGRGWARAAASSLRPLGGSLPEVPAEPAEIEQAFDALDRSTARKEQVKRSSQTGGRLLFAGLGLVLALVLLFVFGAFDSKKKNNAAGPTTSTATTQAAVDYKTLELAVLKPPGQPKSKTQAVAAIAQTVGTQDLSLAIRGVQIPVSPTQGSAYAIWLYTSPAHALLLGFPPLVRKDKVLQTAFQLAKDTGNYAEVLVTRETVEKPTHPGAILLRGPLQVVPADAAW